MKDTHRTAYEAHVKTFRTLDFSVGGIRASVIRSVALCQH